MQNSSGQVETGRAVQGGARQGNTGWGKARQYRVGQGRAVSDMARRDRQRQGRAGWGQDWIEQGEAKQYEVSDTIALEIPLTSSL